MNMDEFTLETGRLFDLCDRENKGYLTVTDLKSACPQLDSEEIAFIFATLDSDSSGRIDRSEFVGGFQNALCKGENKGFNGMKRRASVVDSGVENASFKGSLSGEITVEVESASESESSGRRSRADYSTVKRKNEDIYNSESDVGLDFSLPCQDELLMLYEQLQTSGMPQILGRFEKIVGSFCKELKEQKDQNVRLQHVFESERESYNRRMNEVESEMDQHISETEKKVREEERRKLKQEKLEMRKQMEAEMAELKENLAEMQKIEEKIKIESSRTEQTAELREKLQDLSNENRNLKSNLADSHLELAVIKSELSSVKAEYETRKEEMLSDSEAILQTEKQRENLQRQLCLLYEANKKLHDTNDSLREALNQRSVACKQLVMQTASVMTCASPSFEEQRQALARSPCACCAEGKSGELPPAVSYEGYYPCDADNERMSTISIADENANEDCNFGEATGPPERTFRIVMCGDASVGKSSIVTRVIKGVFTGNLPSTLGVDFHVKAGKIDGKNVAVQLWDTAGQERFRSLCKSYFRRADGAILVYDCSVEQTFLRVRDWIDTIKESTLRPIPILLCANKIDLRNGVGDIESCGYVSTCNGSALSAAMGVMFAECSALDGSNVERALAALTRELMATEDVEIRSSGVVLTQNKSSSSCCGKK